MLVFKLKTNIYKVNAQLTFEKKSTWQKHGVQGIVVELVDTAQCIVVEKFEARFPCRLYLLTSLSCFRLLRCVSNNNLRENKLSALD